MVTARLLCAAGADTELEANTTGAAALHLAVVDGNLELARVLVHEGGAALNHRTAMRRQSALHLAAMDGRTDFVKMLCAAGADTEIREGGTGYMPLHSAVSEGHMEATVALMECGANPDSRSLMRECCLLGYTVRHRFAVFTAAACTWIATQDSAAGYDVSASVQWSSYALNTLL